MAKPNNLDVAILEALKLQQEALEALMATTAYLAMLLEQAVKR